MRFFLMLISVLLAGCSYSANVPVSPARDVITSYGNPVPGKWLLYVDTQGLDARTKTEQFACSAHRFPVKAVASFNASAVQAIKGTVENVEVVQNPINAEKAAQAGAHGVIVIQAESVRPQLDFKPGFGIATMAAQATVVAKVTVDSRQGRLMGQTVIGKGASTANVGVSCEGGAAALSGAVSDAIADAMRNAAEAIANSSRVRSAPSA